MISNSFIIIGAHVSSARAPFCTFVRGETTARVLDLSGPSVRVGRGPRCEVRLNESALADVQCLLRRRGQSWQVQPVGPPGRLSIEGRAVEHARPLPLGVPLLVGDTWLTIAPAEPLVVEHWGEHAPATIAPFAAVNEPFINQDNNEIIEESLQYRPRDASAVGAIRGTLEQRERRLRERLEQLRQPSSARQKPAQKPIARPVENEESPATGTSSQTLPDNEEAVVDPFDMSKKIDPLSPAAEDKIGPAPTEEMVVDPFDMSKKIDPLSPAAEDKIGAAPTIADDFAIPEPIDVEIIEPDRHDSTDADAPDEPHPIEVIPVAETFAEVRELLDLSPQRSQEIVKRERDDFNDRAAETAPPPPLKLATEAPVLEIQWTIPKPPPKPIEEPAPPMSSRSSRGFVILNKTSASRAKPRKAAPKAEPATPSIRPEPRPSDSSRHRYSRRSPSPRRRPTVDRQRKAGGRGCRPRILAFRRLDFGSPSRATIPVGRSGSKNRGDRFLVILARVERLDDPPSTAGFDLEKIHVRHRLALGVFDDGDDRRRFDRARRALGRQR